MYIGKSVDKLIREMVSYSILKPGRELLCPLYPSFENALINEMVYDLVDVSVYVSVYNSVSIINDSTLWR